MKRVTESRYLNLENTFGKPSATCTLYSTFLADFILLTKQTQTIGHRKKVLIEILEISL
jgi:hypothetical protein